jgi:two-component system sensor histidine kinase DesK
MTVDYGDLPPDVSTVLATVLREGVTNVLRHSKGELCEIAIRRDDAGDGTVHLYIVNDGVTGPDDGGADRNGDHWGSGIRNMSDRVAALGGELVAGFQGDGRFRLCARVPVSD